MLLAQRKPASDTQFRDHTSHLRRRRRCASNEITNITTNTGSSWIIPAHDAVGNTTSFPQPNDPTSSYDATYDAWNRLVKLVDGGNTVAEYAYDGRNFRIVKRTFDAGVLDETRHFYYSSNWQVLEERAESSASSSSSSSSSSATGGQIVNRQFVWGKRYIDDLVCRDRDTTGDGILNERRYFLSDANFNVTTLIQNNAAVSERAEYDAYGKPSFFSGSWTPRAASAHGLDILYCGYRYDTESRLYQVRNRVLHAELGRWLQRDYINYARGGKFRS